MNSRALLTALLFGSAIAGTRLVAQAPEPEPKKLEQQAAADPAQCLAQTQELARQTTAGAIDGHVSVDTARSPRCSG